MEQSADYIVAGAGSAGCVLARRLAQSGATVILLEAGGPDRTRLVRKPGMIAIFHNVPALKKRLDWGYYTAPQASALGRRIPQPRGRVLGGSGSINGMLFVRGNRKNYDDWAAAGCAGWSFADVLPSFKRLEDWEDGASALRGSGGPVKVRRQKDLTPASAAFIEALAATAGVKKIDDYNGESQEGAAVFQQNASGGLRYSSSVGYLDHHGLPNLEIITRALITRVVISHGRATGVEVVTKAGRGTITASREVILCAGVYGSAQLLMLSGVGPAEHLRQHGIAVVADLPVGDNLHDHMFVPMTYCMTSARNRGTTPYFVGGIVSEAIRGDTWMGRTVFEAVGFVRSPRVSGLGGDPGHPGARAAVVLSVPQPGLTRAAEGRPAPRADDHAHADLPEEPGHPAARLGGSGRRAGHRPGLPDRARRQPAAAGRDRAHPGGDGQQDHRRPGQPGAEPRAGLPGPGRVARSCRTGRPRCTTRSAPAGWAPTRRPWWIRRCGSGASTGSGSPTPRSCPASPAGTRTPRR